MFDAASIEIRPFEERDRSRVLAITEAAWSPVFSVTEGEVPAFVLHNFFPDGWMPRQLEEVTELLDTESDMMWVALVSKRIAGFVGLREHPRDRMGEIYIVAVDPAFQRAGVARALIEHCETVVRQRGLTMMMVETIGDEGHRPARETYEAMGYVRWPVARYLKPLD